MALWLLAFLVLSKKTSEEPDFCKPQSDDIESIIVSKACYNNIDRELFLRIAKCESGLKIDVKNKHSTASGIFQWLDSSFIHYAKAYNFSVNNKNDPEIQAELAAKVIANGGIDNWKSSKYCWSLDK